MSSKQVEFKAWLEHARDQASGSPIDTPMKLRNLVLQAIAYADDKHQRSGGIARRTEHACQAGCDWCCHLPVQTTVAEAVYTVEFALEHFSSEELASCRARADAAATRYPQYANHGAVAYKPLPCPYLVARRCTVYPARPLTCRGWNSHDAQACRQAFDRGPTTVRIPVDQRTRMVYSMTGVALAKGFSQSGLDGHVYLAPTVQRLLNTPNLDTSITRWLRGETRFESP